MGGAYKRGTTWSGMSGQDARRAQAALNNYKSTVRSWQTQAEDLPNYDRIGAVDLWTYLGYTPDELAGYTTYDQFAASIRARRDLIKDKVTAMRDRHIARERKVAKNIRARIKTTTGYSIRGRPSLPLLKEGQYVYLAVAYNNGQGAGFEGYSAGGETATPAFRPTDITSWSGSGSLQTPWGTVGGQEDRPGYTASMAKQHVLAQITRNRRRR